MRAKRKIKVAVLALTPLNEAFLKSLLSKSPLIVFDEQPSSKTDAFVIEHPLLTKTEQKILQAMVDLGKIEAVAAKLEHHPVTVRRYLCRIYGKLKVKSAPQAVALAIRLRLIR